jgi:metallo-beta-lactamase class B
LTANLTPGHTPGCTSWSMTTPVDRPQGGVEPHQAVFYCSTTVAGNPLVGNTEYPEIASDYRKSFAKLKAMKADIFLAAHARFFDAHSKEARIKAGSPNPFVVPGELQRYVAASESDFNKEFADQKAKAAH